MKILGVRICKVRGCDELHQAKGRCNTHYLRYKRLGSDKLAAKQQCCNVRGCYFPPTCGGLCHNHYEQEQYKTRPKRVRT